MSSLLRLAHIALFELDLVIFLVSGVGTALFNLVLSAKQTHRAHYLADATLWHEFRGHTVSIKLLFAVAFCVIAPSIFLLEYFVVSPSRQLRSSRRLLTSLRFALGTLTATMLNLVFVEGGKNYVGYLRPSFARTCVGARAFGSLSGAALTPASAPCTAHGAKLFESRRSFPSGHASLAVGATMYFQLYLLRAARGRAWVALISYAPMAFALFVAASRIVDNAHHPADVVAGCLLGMWPAMTHFWYVERATAEKESEEREGKAENGIKRWRKD